jgi:hypothetical protein
MAVPPCAGGKAPQALGRGQPGTGHAAGLVMSDGPSWLPESKVEERSRASKRPTRQTLVALPLSTIARIVGTITLQSSDIGRTGKGEPCATAGMTDKVPPLFPRQSCEPSH